MARGIFQKGNTAEPAGANWMSRIIEGDCVNVAGIKRLRKIDEDGTGVAVIFQWGRAEKNLADL
jgi:hypothetical protein